MESKEHLQLKADLKSRLIARGYKVSLEKSITNDCCVDVYGEKDDRIVIVEVIHSQWTGKDPAYILRQQGIRKKVLFFRVKTEKAKREGYVIARERMTNKELQRLNYGLQDIRDQLQSITDNIVNPLFNSNQLTFQEISHLNQLFL